MVKRRHAVFLMAAAALAGCDDRRAAAERWTAEGEAMGSTWRLVMAGPEEQREECRRLVDTVIEENVRMFSTWRADSELSRINQGGLEVGQASASFRRGAGAGPQRAGGLGRSLRRAAGQGG